MDNRIMTKDGATVQLDLEHFNEGEHTEWTNLHIKTYQRSDTSFETSTSLYSVDSTCLKKMAARLLDMAKELAEKEQLRQYEFMKKKFEAKTVILPKEQ